MLVRANTRSWDELRIFQMRGGAYLVESEKL